MVRARVLLPEQEEEENNVINRKLHPNAIKSLLYVSFFVVVVRQYFMTYLLNPLTFYRTLQNFAEKSRPKYVTKLFAFFYFS